MNILYYPQANSPMQSYFSCMYYQLTPRVQEESQRSSQIKSKCQMIKFFLTEWGWTWKYLSLGKDVPTSLRTASAYLTSRQTFSRAAFPLNQ